MLSCLVACLSTCLLICLCICLFTHLYTGYKIQVAKVVIPVVYPFVKAAHRPTEPYYTVMTVRARLVNVEAAAEATQRAPKDPEVAQNVHLAGYTSFPAL